MNYQKLITYIMYGYLCVNRATIDWLIFYSFYFCVFIDFLICVLIYLYFIWLN